MNKDEKKFDSLKRRWDDVKHTFDFHAKIMQEAMKELSQINDEIYPLEVKLNKER